MIAKIARLHDLRQVGSIAETVYFAHAQFADKHSGLRLLLNDLLKDKEDGHNELRTIRMLPERHSLFDGSAQKSHQAHRTITSPITPPLVFVAVIANTTVPIAAKTICA